MRTQITSVPAWPATAHPSGCDCCEGIAVPDCIGPDTAAPPAGPIKNAAKSAGISDISNSMKLGANGRGNLINMSATESAPSIPANAILVAFHFVLLFNLLLLLSLVGDSFHLCLKSFFVAEIIVIQHIEIVIELVYERCSRRNVYVDNLVV